jgi:hypothetical protein
MSENIVPVAKPAENPERFKTIIVGLTVFTTVFAALLAALQVDASIRANQANRDSQYYAIAASGELHRSQLASNYELAVFGDYLKNLQEATVLQLSALEQDQAGNQESVRSLKSLAAVAQARADAGRKFSIFYTDPRYAPKTEDGLPNEQAYLDDSLAEAKRLVEKQNKASDDYHLWNGKSDAYVNVLTILALAFFLFGIAQAVKNTRLRLVFTLFGLAIILTSMLWSAYILVR